jgi:hypothetical protein
MITTSNAVMSFILCLPRIISHALLGLSLLVLTGCSSVRVAYNQSDTLVYWWVDRYVDLTPEQKPLVKTALADLLRWHRAQQLPEYIQLAQRIRGMAERDIQADEVCAVTQDMQASYLRLLERIEPAATQLVVQLHPSQLRSMRQRYDKTNDEWREEWMDGSAEKRRRHRVKQALSRLEEFYGRLDTSQRTVVEQWISQSSFDSAQSYEGRLRRQAESLQTFERMAQIGQASATTQAMLHGWVERSFFSPDPAYRAYSQMLWLENCAGFAKLHNSTTPEQRLQLAETLLRYENDFRALMRL